MPTMPATLSNPGTLLALCLIVGLVIGVNATLLSLFRHGSGRGDGGAGPWSRALSGARERQQQQTDQMDALHRAVSTLSPDPAGPDHLNE